LQRIACSVDMPWKAMSGGANQKAPFTVTVRRKPAMITHSRPCSASMYSSMVKARSPPAFTSGNPSSAISAKIAISESTRMAPEPGAQRRAPQHHRPVLALEAFQRAQLRVSLDERVRAAMVERRVAVHAPIVHGDGDVVEEHVVAGKVEVDHAPIALLPQHVV